MKRGLVAPKNRMRFMVTTNMSHGYIGDHSPPSPDTHIFSVGEYNTLDLISVLYSVSITT